MENRNFMTLTEDELYEVNGGMTEEDAGGGGGGWNLQNHHHHLLLLQVQEKVANKL